MLTRLRLARSIASPLGLALLSACSSLVDGNVRLTDASFGDGEADALSRDGDTEDEQAAPDSGESCTPCAMRGEPCSYNCPCCGGPGLPATTCIGTGTGGVCDTIGGP